ncbi:UvrD-helicase domain-containing protein [Aerolutibacter ruishenii]|uniref:RecBCD enzyme subunit RecB n=1 Tax=Aerolutibacter ruishenii TaxID=686800 RepID=A0A562LRN1_9GAMM|nr:UvrD-helicase domain-containing protein [Lysobacter ruishenii]TWI10304.1 exodeoxyribonuclease V beta subunit [Lysobacter ruishenii]
MTEARDWRQLTLRGNGRALVEASAGTGKTWTIGALYLRLLLETRDGEPPLSPRQIVVATYTNAAADELRRRLRTRLLDTLDLALRGFDAAPDPHHTDLDWLHARWLDRKARIDDTARLQLALAELDLAPVSTLHRLCARILADHPFAAGAAFRMPEMVDSRQLVDALADDLWRVVQSPTPLPPDTERVRAAAHALAKPLVRKDLSALLQGLVAPGVHVPVPEVEEDHWPSEQVAPLRLLAQDDAVLNKKAVLRRLLAQLAELIETKGDPGAWMASEDRGKLADNARNRTGVLKAAVDRPDVIATLDFAAAFAERLQAFQTHRHARFLSAVQAWARTELDRRLATAGQLGFDDLLTTVHAALQPAPDGSRALADALFATWPVALIDEFQDTDPVQYGILDAIYRDNNGAPRGRLVVIGDPKQAIYRFRGGDIHTYERAKAYVAEQDRLTLDVNHRSSADYVEAVNQFYNAVGAQLGAPASRTSIAFEPVKASGRRDATPYRGPESAGEHCLVLHRADPDEDEGGDLDALRSCANRIAILLDPVGGHAIADEALQASDLCVLVPNNWHARRMLELLRERGVPCVQRGRHGVFDDNDVATDLLVVLHAVIHCREPAPLRAALATGLWGTGYQALRALRDDTARWQQEVVRFHRWQRLWRERGVLAVVTALIDEVARAHLDTRDGHRVLTDLRHLGELLQAQEEQADGPESVLKWMQQRLDGAKNGDEDEADATALRIESDARCVQVMTLHGSKGLEFNLVMLPLMWAHRGKQKHNAKGVRTLSAADGTRRVVLDESGRAEVEREEQDERYRVLYVALTRAVHACHVWLDPALDANASDPLASPLALATPQLDTSTLHALAADRIAVVEGWKAPRTTVATPPTRVRTGDEARAWPVLPDTPLPARHSFTTLTARRRAFEADPWAAAGDERDVATVADDLPVTARTPHPDLDSLLGVAGADFGNAVHGILELRAPGQPLAAHRTLMLEQLAKYNVRHRELDADALADRLLPRLQAVLDTRLDGADLRLAALPAHALRAELEFNYALDGASLDRLRAACEQLGHPDLIPARTPVLAGLMNGKIDLVFEHGGRFHVLDWKGNDLGDGSSACLEDYAPDALERKMDATRYRFQALLYTVAVERYLRERLGDAYQRARHLGDCWYLFVRATGLHLPDGRACGIWHHRFDDALLDAVQAALSTVAAQEAA